MGILFLNEISHLSLYLMLEADWSYQESSGRIDIVHLSSESQGTPKVKRNAMTTKRLAGPVTSPCPSPELSLNF